ncbi:MAG: lectin [Cellvibrio sp. 79]|nr:MAG: lectin [Cellvibrio sp. 79]
MKLKTLALCTSLFSAGIAFSSLPVAAQQPPRPQAPQITPEEALQKFSFFTTSTGLGKGANLGGLAGADAHCQALAKAAGAGNKTWRAYLSTQAADGKPAINARDRIGKGPWYNVKGALIANDVGHLHGDTLAQAQLGSNLTRNQALTEKGERVLGAGDTPNQHDILTGSKTDGTAFTDSADHTCKNYTSNATDGSVQVGHFDRTGGGNASWNSAHPSRGCTQENLVGTGGAGLFYCFVAN